MIYDYPEGNPINAGTFYNDILDAVTADIGHTMPLAVG